MVSLNQQIDCVDSVDMFRVTDGYVVSIHSNPNLTYPFHPSDTESTVLVWLRSIQSKLTIYPSVDSMR